MIGKIKQMKNEVINYFKTMSDKEEPAEIIKCNVCDSRELSKIDRQVYCTSCGTVLR